MAEQNCPSPEDRDCFRQDQRNKRVRAAPQDSPYITFSIADAATTTTTTIAPAPPELIQLIQLPDSGVNVYCPSLKDYRPPMYFDSVGGDQTYDIPNDGNDRELKVHTFSNDGFFSIQPYQEVQDIFDYAEVEIILIGGGGGGGTFDGSGGGGAGEFKRTRYKFPAGNYEIKIGEGGDAGFNGQDTEIATYSIKAIGGGAGGDSFETDSAKTGASGGGAGGRSNSTGAKGILGKDGGSSIGNVGGGGGGGGGAAGQSVPVTVNNVALNAGNGGSGITISLDGKTYNDYVGGGAGDPFNNLVLGRSLGGGGSTVFKDGLNGTGSGGSGNGGKGGKGSCILYFVPVTTPPPTTTTTKAPEAPVIHSLSCNATYRKIDISFDYTSLDTPAESYTITAYKGSEVWSDETVPLSQGLGSFNVYDDIKNLQDEQEYLINVTVKNSAGVSNLVLCRSTTVTTTPTTTTTLPPDFVSFILEFDGEITNGYVGSDSVTVNGQEGSQRTAEIDIIASSGVFYDPPQLTFFGDGQSLINIDGISINPSEDRKKIDISIPVTMPFQPEIRALIYFVAAAVEPTTTSTTTTTTTLSPFCQSMYHTAEFFLDEDDKWQHPVKEQRSLYPLQLFLSDRSFPYQITGSTSPSSIVVGSPWYNGKYFEIQRNNENGADYIGSLPINHNEYLLIANNPDGSQDLFPVEQYHLFYPDVSANSISKTYNKLILSDGSYRLDMSITLDYVCSVTDPSNYGKGSENVSGFTHIVIKESSSVDNETILVNKFLEFSTFRTTDTFNSVLRGNTWSYLIDYGTLDRIVGQ